MHDVSILVNRIEMLEGIIKDWEQRGSNQFVSQMMKVVLHQNKKDLERLQAKE